MIALSQKWLAKIMKNAFPDMDYHIVSVILNDGRHFNEVVIDRGYITKVNNSENIPFSVSDIHEIIPPYDRWIRLSSKLTSQLLEMPESGMGYTFVLIRLHDGRSYNALINSGFITKVKEHEDIPFSSEDIASIEFSTNIWN